MAERLSQRPDGSEGGFTIIEILIALLVLLIGMAGVLSLQLTSVEATAFSRHATEASVLAEDKMEQLRTVPLAVLSNGLDQVDARGVIDAAGLYARTWTIDGRTVEVTVSWSEQGNVDEQLSVTLRSERNQ